MLYQICASHSLYTTSCMISIIKTNRLSIWSRYITQNSIVCCQIILAAMNIHVVFNCAKHLTRETYTLRKSQVPLWDYSLISGIGCANVCLRQNVQLFHHRKHIWIQLLTDECPNIRNCANSYHLIIFPQTSVDKIMNFANSYHQIVHTILPKLNLYM